MDTRQLQDREKGQHRSLGLRDNLPKVSQMLSLTCDNASRNNKMVEELAMRVTEFPGQANHTCCFAHIINLVAKSLLKQFDLPENKAESAVSSTQEELQEFMEELEMDSAGSTAGTEGPALEDADDLDGFIDEREGMLEGELEELENSVQPVKLVLMNVCSHIVT